MQYEQLYKKVFDSSDVAWGGPGSLAPAITQPGQPFLINPLSAIVFEQPDNTTVE